MGATTPRALPWPEPTQFLGQTNLYIRQLAEAVELMRPDYCDMSNGAGSQPVSNNAWTLCGVGTTTGSRGNGITPAGSNVGLKVTRAMRVMVTGYAEFPLNVTGRRGISFTTDPGGGNAVNSRRVIQMANTGGTTPMSFAFQFNLSANASIGLMLFQDSGTALNATTAMFTATEL
jgi:hypothetical protein